MEQSSGVKWATENLKDNCLASHSDSDRALVSGPTPEHIPLCHVPWRYGYKSIPAGADAWHSTLHILDFST